MGRRGRDGNTPPPPKEYDDTISSSGTYFFIDLLCEGPIKGLVQDKRSIYFDKTQLEYEDGSTDFELATRNFVLEDNFKFGTPNQAGPTSDFKNTCSFLELYDNNEVTKIKPITFNVSTATFQLLSKVLINIKVPSLQLIVDKSGLDYGVSGWTEEQVHTAINASNAGDTREAPVELNIFVRKNNGAEELVHNVRVLKKCSGGCIFSKEVSFPQVNSEFPSLSWDNSENATFFVRISRVSEDNKKTQKLSNRTIIDSMLVFQDISLTYPNSAYAALKLNTESFQSLPERLYLLDLKLCKVPANYTTPRFDLSGNFTRYPNYSGVWNGSFKLDWTNNPAWIMYDLMTSKRYGLGDQIPYSNIDKWSLYKIGQFCDAADPVDGSFDGVYDIRGNLEQRFTANLFLSETNDAYNVLKDFSSIFRGNVFWNSNYAFSVQDAPKQVVQVFTNANVINGEFSYSTAETKQKPSSVKVRWNDPADFYLPKTEHTEDLRLLSKQGVKELDVAAFGCTSQSQARRFGRWILNTENLETQLVRFRTYIDGVSCVPGDIIEISDNIRNRSFNGGRVISSSGSTVTLDKIVPSAIGGAISITNYSDNLIPILSRPDSVTNSSQISSIRPSYISRFNIIGQSDDVLGGATVLTLDGSTAAIQPYSAFSITSLSTLNNNKYRVLSFSEIDEDGNVELSCLEYDESKFDDSEISAGEAAGDANNSGIDYGNYSVYPPTQLNLFNYVPPASKIYGSFDNGSGSFIGGYNISGRLTPTGSYFPITKNADNSFDYYLTQTGYYEVVVRTRRSDGFLSDGITGFVTGLMYSQDVGSVVDSPSAVLVNGTAGSPTYFASPNPTFEVESAYGVTSQPYRDTSDIFIRISNAVTSGIALDWTSLGGPIYDTPTTIDNSGLLDGTLQITGWKFRKMNVDVYATIGDTPGAITTSYFENTAPPPCDITFSSVTNNSFDFYIAPSGSFIDLQGVDFYISTGLVQPTGVFATKYSFVDSLTHDLSNTGVYVWFKPMDTFGDVECVTNGPFLVYSPTTAYGFTSNVSGELKSFSTSRKTGEYLEFSWNKADAVDLTCYVLEVQNNSGIKHSFVVPKNHEIVSGRILANAVGLEYDYLYSGRIKTVRGAIEDDFGAWSNTSSLISPKNKHWYSDNLKSNRLYTGGGFDNIYLSNSFVSGQNYTVVDGANASGNNGLVIGDSDNSSQNVYLRVGAAPGFTGIAISASGASPFYSPNISRINCAEGASDIDFSYTSGNFGTSKIVIDCQVNISGIDISRSIGDQITKKNAFYVKVNGGTPRVDADYMIWQSGNIYYYEVEGLAKNYGGISVFSGGYIIKDFGAIANNVSGGFGLV